MIVWLSVLASASTTSTSDVTGASPSGFCAMETASSLLFLVLIRGSVPSVPSFSDMEAAEVHLHHARAVLLEFTKALRKQRRGAGGLRRRTPPRSSWPPVQSFISLNASQTCSRRLYVQMGRT
eukprot:GHVU01092929.1.p2 GENE.GHVU01092929.1~~GHVU01092929.1.p2  ORF type:complete len:123 (+),score=6.43 GHVU01092929.1:1854-2222(+)